MKTYRFTIKTQSAFGTPLVGDSLFGQICWEIVNRLGETKLEELLQGYCKQKPFLVVSDALPSGYLPLPCLPSEYWQAQQNSDYKILKKKQWISYEVLNQPLEQWQQAAKAEKELLKKSIQEQLHNTINRQTNTTGEAPFAPYSMSQIWYQNNTALDIYCVMDETRFDLESLKQLLEQIGLFGFGRDASIGLGKFRIEKVEILTPRLDGQHNAYFTLANCAPQGLGLKKEYCFYRLTTRFGRHGNIKALSSNPFKKPIILAKTAAVFTPEAFEARLFLGNGLTNISQSQPNAVHQGYAPVIPLLLDFARLG